MSDASNKATGSHLQANENILSGLAFKNSIQSNIISTVSSGKIIMVNSAACRLLGYTKKDLLTKNRSDIFDINEISFKKMLKQRTAEGRSKAFITVIKKSGTRISCEITSAVFHDEHKTKKSITTISELTKETPTDKQAASNKWIKNIATTSYDVMWDWNIDTGRIYVGNSIKEILGYTVINNTVNLKDVKHCLIATEKNRVEIKLLKVLDSTKNTWKDSFQFKRRNGSMASTECRANIVRNEQGKAIRLIGAMQDISHLEELEKKLQDATLQKEGVKTLTAKSSPKAKLYSEYRESFRLIFNSSADVLFDVDLEADEVMISDAYQREFGYDVSGNLTPATDWLNHIHPDDKLKVQQDYLNMLSSKETKWKCTYRFLRADNSVADIESTRIILRNSDGKAYRMLGNMHDVSKQTIPEETLLQDIRLKEKEIAEASEDAKNAVRSDIGRELHDNVNQLLSASSLYISMARNGGKNSKMCLDRSSEYTLSAIKAIRELSKELTTNTIKEIGLCKSIKNSIRDLMEVSHVSISFSTKRFKEDEVGNSFQLAVFRIVQEQLNNIMKHAHAEKVQISIIGNNKDIILRISDNGIGFNTQDKCNGIGMKNIKTRAASFNAAVEFVSQPGMGCVLSVAFPTTDAMMHDN